MPYSSPFVKLNIAGHFGSTSTDKKEQWIAGLHIAAPAGIVATPVELNLFMNAIATAVSTFHTNAANLVGPSCWLDELNAALIGVDGKYVLGALQGTTRLAYGTPVAGGGSSQGGPWSQALVWTLRSAILRGPGSHGRVYYPAVGAQVSAGAGLLAAASCVTISGNVKTLLNAINVAASTNLGTSCNVSLVSPKGSGQRSPVLQVGIGERLDSMESRERNLVEAWHYNTLTVASALQAAANEEYRDQLEDYFDQLEREREDQ